MNFKRRPAAETVALILLCVVVGLGVALLASLPGCAPKAPPPPPTATVAPAPAPKPADPLRPALCPVKLIAPSPSIAPITYHGVTYKFCCADCVNSFRLDPDHYARASALAARR